MDGLGQTITLHPEAAQGNGRKPKTRTIAICGTASSSRPEIIVQPANVEMWGLNAAYNWMPRLDRLFDIHHQAPTREGKHLDWLKENTKIPVYMQEHYEHIPASIRYPLEDVLEGGKYRKVFTSSIGYMIALAIHEGATELRLLGVDMATDAEYAYQRDACLYWIGIAEGRGIKVYLPKVSPLSQAFQYGWDSPVKDPRRGAMDMRDKVKTQIDKDTETLLDTLRKLLEEHRRNADACTGALQLAEQMIRAEHDEPETQPEKLTK